MFWFQDQVISRFNFISKRPDKFLRILPYKEINKKNLKKIKGVSMFIKNDIIYVCKKKNYLHAKYKDFHFSVLKKWKASKKRYIVQNVLEKMSGDD